MRWTAILAFVCPLVALAGIPGDVNDDGITDAADLSCVTATIFDPAAGCARATISYERIVVVSPVEHPPGTPDHVASGAELLAAVADITTSGPDRPFLVQVEPGTYDLVTTPLALPEWVHLSGSGRELTTILGSADSPLIVVGPNSEVRSLTVHQNGGAKAVAIGTAEGVGSGSRRIENVRLVADGSGQNFGVLVEHAIVIRNASVRAEGGGEAVGVLVIGGGGLEVDQVRAEAASATECYGLRLDANTTVSGWNSTATASSGTTCAGALVENGRLIIELGGAGSSNCATSRGLEVRNAVSVVSSSWVSGSCSAVGCTAEGAVVEDSLAVFKDSEIAADSFNGTSIGLRGVYVDGSFDTQIDVNRSRVYAPYGGSQTIVAAASVRIKVGASQLEGGDVNPGAGSIDCVYCYDEDYTSPGISTCP